MNNDEILKNASKHLGKTPQELKNMVNKLSPQQAQQLNKALGDEEYAKKILSSPQAQAIIKKLMGK